MVIDQFKPHVSGSLRGFVDITMPSGLSICGLAVFEKNGERWLKFPARRWQNKDGKWFEEPVMKIEDRDRKKKFDGAVLAALDAHVGGRA